MILRTKPVLITLGLILLATACQIEQLPAADQQAEVDTTCESWAEALSACASAGPEVDELADSCRESITVDNPNDDASCRDALLDNYACVGGLSCDELAAYSDRTGDYPCKSESDVVSGAC
ncbi:MAG TPA: hypothetical protein VM869_12685 [Enhygromyxa sp.]|nr:hypothetical protein [Enhygromyxa sp.]